VSLLTPLSPNIVEHLKQTGKLTKSVLDGLFTRLARTSGGVRISGVVEPGLTDRQDGSSNPAYQQDPGSGELALVTSRRSGTSAPLRLWLRSVISATLRIIYRVADV
jgi:hypothetical protein